MACGNIENSYLRGCDLGSSGIRKFWFAKYSGGTAMTYDADGIISGGTSVAPHYLYEMKEETGSVTQNVIASPTGNVSFEIITEMVFLYNRQEVRNRVDELVSATSSIIAEDENGQRWYIGETRGCSPNGGTGAFGVSASDENSFRISFRTLESSPIRQIDTDGTYDASPALLNS